MKKTLIHMSIAGLLILASQAAMSGQPGQQEKHPFNTRAFYGDKVLNRVVVIDVHKTREVGSVDTIGKTPYPVDQAGKLDKV